LIYAAFRGELFKVVRRPGIWVLVSVLLVLAILVGYVITWLIYTFPPPGSSQGLPAGTTLADFKIALYPENFVKQTLTQWGVLGGVFALIVGVLMQGSEYGWGTIKTLYTQRAGRLTMLFGKIAALAVVVLVMVVALFAVDAASSSVVALVDGKAITFPGADVITKGVIAAFLIFAFWAVFGLALSTLFRQSAMAIGLGLAYALVVEVLIFGLLSGLGGDIVQQIQQWFPIANANYLSQSFGTINPRGFQGQGAPFADGTHAVVMLLVYVAAFAVMTAWLSKTRDITA
jgi:ABC-type transport system involved in multi-copper enzyme maturation permease subunit